MLMSRDIARNSEYIDKVFMQGQTLKKLGFFMLFSLIFATAISLKAKKFAKLYVFVVFVRTNLKGFDVVLVIKTDITH